MSRDRNVRVTHSGWGTTGQNVLVSRYQMSMTIRWVDDAGVEQTWTGNVQFPDVLTGMTAAWIREKLWQLVYEAKRAELGID